MMYKQIMNENRVKHSCNNKKMYFIEEVRTVYNYIIAKLQCVFNYLLNVKYWS